MKAGWVKKISMALMLALTLGTVACGSGQGSDEGEALENFLNDENAGAREEGSVEFFDDGGSITRTDDFVSVNTGDGGSFVCENGECNLF